VQGGGIEAALEAAINLRCTERPRLARLRRCVLPAFEGSGKLRRGVPLERGDMGAQAF
jgi:hypothetical protein